MATNNSLLSTQTNVESPFIIVKIGNYTFGHCSKVDRGKMNTIMKVVYPNYVNELNIVKVNGAVNTYTLKIAYAITENNDPNFIDKVLSSVSKTRKITLSYGDWLNPSFIYKEEEAIITKVSSSMSFESSRIDYTIQATSSTLMATGAGKNFGGITAKPSDEIKKLFKNKSNGLLDLFPGMKDDEKNNFSTFIDGNDQKVEIKPQSNISLIDYIGYLVSCMVNIHDNKNDVIRNYRYYWASYDDITSKYGGTYIKVVCVQANAKFTQSYNTYEVDVGYPTNNKVSAFALRNDDSWALLYDYNLKSDTSSYDYKIDNAGNITSTITPSIVRTSKYFSATENSKNWWTQVTQFPISATLQVKGLLRPAMLMSYVKINTYFYGHKHISSGLYIITKQEDIINSQGYKTNLTLTRLSGDEMG